MNTLQASARPGQGSLFCRYAPVWAAASITALAICPARLQASISPYRSLREALPKSGCRPFRCFDFNPAWVSGSFFIVPTRP